MASLTTALKLMNLAYGESGAYGYTNWGDLTDANHDIIENALTGQSAIAVTTADVTLTDAQHVSLHLNLTGLLTGNRSILLKATQPGMWFVSNGTTGAYTVTVKPSGGTGVVVDQGKKAIVYSDGTNAIAIYDAGDFYTAAEVDSLVTAESVEISEDFVATGSITLGNFVALRSDGTVEVVAGSETVASVGSDSTVTAVTSMRWLASATNVTSSKVIAVYYDLGAANTLYVVIGTLSGTTISWGSPQTFTGGTGATHWTRGRAVWNAAGDKVVIAFRGASGYQSFVCASVSGTTLTFGSVVQNGTVSHSTGGGDYHFLHHDNTHGSRFVFYDPGTGNIVAGTYSGTTITLGTSASFVVTFPKRVFFDETNVRLIIVGASTSTQYVRAATISGTTWTAGSEVNTTTISMGIPCFEASSGKVGILGIPTASSGAFGLIYACVVTFSGTTPTFNTATKVADYSMEGQGFDNNIGYKSAYDSTNSKCLFPIRVTDATTAGASDDFSNIAIAIGTISGTSMTITISPVVSGEVSGADIFARSSGGEIAMTYRDSGDFGRMHIVVGKISSGAWVEMQDFLMRSYQPSNPAPTTGWTGITPEQDLTLGWSLIDFTRWGTSGISATFTAFAVQLPTESTNADAWIGVSRETVSNGQTATIRMRGGKATGLSGLTPNTDYYLKGDGTLTTTENGRYAGRAIASTKMLLETL